MVYGYDARQPSHIILYNVQAFYMKWKAKTVTHKPKHSLMYHTRTMLVAQKPLNLDEWHKYVCLLYVSNIHMHIVHVYCIILY